MNAPARWQTPSRPMHHSAVWAPERRRIITLRQVASAALVMPVVCALLVAALALLP